MLHLFRTMRHNMATWAGLTKEDAWPLISDIIFSGNLTTHTTNIGAPYPLEKTHMAYLFQKNNHRMAELLCDFLKINKIQTEIHENKIVFKHIDFELPEDDRDHDERIKNDLISRLKELAPESQTLSLEIDTHARSTLQKISSDLQYLEKDLKRQISWCEKTIIQSTKVLDEKALERSTKTFGNKL